VRPEPGRAWFHGDDSGTPCEGEAPGGGFLPGSVALWERRRAILERLLGQRQAEAQAMRRRLAAVCRQVEELEATAAEWAARAPGTGQSFWTPAPVPAYRAWHLGPQGARGAVQVWPGPRLEAACVRGPGVPHDAPCRCGIYGLKAAAGLRVRPVQPWGLVYGLVALSGRVVEHAAGYRGRRAEARAVAVLWDGKMVCRSDPDWIARLFTPGVGAALAAAAPGVPAVAACAVPPAAVDYLESEARRWGESWISESRSG
jgi:hypothetical protein